MRISTNSMFSTAVSRMSDLQNKLNKTQLQMSAGKRILTPSDDPVAAAQVLGLTQSRSINTQYATNRGYARSSLGQEENALQGVATVLENAKTLAINAGNGGMSSEDLKSLATDLSGMLDELMALANTQDGTGNHIFAGYRTDTKPFAKVPAGAVYNGDQGSRTLQVGAQRQLAIADHGSAVFEGIRSGNGTFAAAAASANTGSGVVSPGVVLDRTALTGHSYSVNFTSPTTFDVVDTTAAVTVSTGNPYTSGNAIAFDGMQIEVAGAPATGDQFTLSPSQNQSVFSTLTDLVNLLKRPLSGDTAKANLANGLSIANSGIDAALNNVLTVHASVGSRLKELDTLDTQGEARDAAYADSLGNLQDLDYTSAISELTKQQIMLQAAQQSFIKTTGLSLFDYIK
jgi:flagellar hook-associated protein 3 FlgL